MQDINLAWPDREMLCWLVLAVTGELRSQGCWVTSGRSSHQRGLTWLRHWIHLSWLSGTTKSHPKIFVTQWGRVSYRRNCVCWEVCGEIWPKFAWGLPLQQHWNSETLETLCPPRSLQAHSIYGFTEKSSIQPCKMGLREIYQLWKQAAVPK